MGCNYFRLSIVLHIISLIALSSTLGYAIAVEKGLSIILFISIIILVILYRIYKIVTHPLSQITLFLLSLRCGDSTMRFPKTGDSVLKQIHSQMYHILKMYINNRKELETSKLYYDRILRIMTHEMRNTITPIASLSNHYVATENKKHSPQELIESMKIINNQCFNIMEFLDSYHILTHLQTPKCEIIAIKELFGDMWNLLRNEPGGDKIKIYAPKMSIFASPMQMQLILGNLLRNALQAIENSEEGKIELRASISEMDPFITVTDNGEGIPTEQQEDIFLPFYSTKKSGSGIGLCMSKQIMHLHGGELSVESNPRNRITTFTMTFPKQKF